MEVAFQTQSRRKHQEAIARPNYQHRGKGRLIINRHDAGDIKFENGLLKTTDKGEIEDVLHSRLYEDGTVELLTDPELVDQYLRGNEPDKLSKDVLNGIEDEGLRKIANVIGIPEKKHKNYAGVMKAMLKGKPITNRVREIMKEYAKEEAEADLFDKAVEQGVIYRNGPWYKLRQGDEQDPQQDYSISKTEQEVQQWIAENTKEIKEKLN